jgi:hypothetical protein
LRIRQIQTHKIEAQDPDLQRLMMARKNGVGHIIKAVVAVVTFVALTSRSVSSKLRLMTCVDWQEGHATPSGHRSSRTIW